MCLTCETLLLKTSHTLTAGHGEVKPLLNWLLAFIVLEQAMQPAGTELSSTSLIIYEYQHARQDVSACAIVPWLSRVRPKAFQLELRPAPQEGVHIWY